MKKVRRNFEKLLDNKGNIWYNVVTENNKTEDLTMTLYEYLKMNKNDFDTYDTVFDTGVTVCYIADEDERDEYDKFCNGIIKKVNVIHINDDSPTVNWYEMIERNIDKFKAFTKKHWYANCQYEDDIDEFIYQWINEIHQYMAGNVSIDFYTVLNKLVDSLE